MKTTPTSPRLENELAPFVSKILAQHHRIEFAFYTKSMKLIIGLRKRHSQQYMPLRLIRRSLSSLKIDKVMAKYLLKDLQECGFLIHMPRRGYRVNAPIDVPNELLYQPSHTGTTMV